ncbi:hypothetical protein WJX84_006394 [Apatococcus fuscideae]|uniref:Uncharacterized protein n=1 Tax=Apatococcus fuscideae TaxID=2026836 RepID=A0AAW1SV92_9CHLO
MSAPSREEGLLQRLSRQFCCQPSLCQASNGSAPSLRRTTSAPLQTRPGSKQRPAHRRSTEIAATSLNDPTSIGHEQQITEFSRACWQDQRERSCERQHGPSQRKSMPDAVWTARILQESLQHAASLVRYAEAEAPAKPAAVRQSGSVLPHVSEPSRRDGFLSFRVSAVDDILGTCVFSDWGEGEDLEPSAAKSACPR